MQIKPSNLLIHSQWRTAVQHKHKLNHFYSPNIQSKSIIDSQTSTVKIQPFFFLDTEGHCLKIVVHPVEFTCFFHDSYAYGSLFIQTLEMTFYVKYFFFRPGSESICRLVCVIWWYRTIQPITEKLTWLAFLWFFHFSLTVCCEMNPADSCCAPEAKANSENYLQILFSTGLFPYSCLLLKY